MKSIAFCYLAFCLLSSVLLKAQEMTKYSGKLVDSEGKENSCIVELNGSESGNIGVLTFGYLQGTAVLEGRKTQESGGNKIFEGVLNINGNKSFGFGLVLGENILGVALKQNGQTFSTGILTKSDESFEPQSNNTTTSNLDPQLFGFWEGESVANSTRSKYMFIFLDGGLMNCMKSEFWVSGYGGSSTSFNSQSPMKQEPWATQIVNEGGRWYSKNGKIWIKTPNKSDYQLFNYQTNGYELILQAQNFNLKCIKMQN